ncbi:hypothetical protein JVT61DRAFT_13556 [Boletus reticuloceps]|uniref:Uncharacterized protein n=1 Tax=Boletus reticuloceps TaxID=495285 RepID=A0A8I3A2Q2_9AGAM|nr:hypothetical protein JVT61DRAFT_13556 [Boletus reticuloceps]
MDPSHSHGRYTQNQPPRLISIQVQLRSPSSLGAGMPPEPTASSGDFPDTTSQPTTRAMLPITDATLGHPFFPNNASQATGTYSLDCANPGPLAPLQQIPLPSTTGIQLHPSPLSLYHDTTIPFDQSIQPEGPSWPTAMLPPPPCQDLERVAIISSNKPRLTEAAKQIWKPQAINIGQAQGHLCKITPPLGMATGVILIQSHAHHTQPLRLRAVMVLVALHSLPLPAAPLIPTVLTK